VGGFRAVEDAASNRLVAGAQRGDAGAFQGLYLRYYDLVYAYGRMMLKDAHEAEDVTQDVFIRVLRLLPGYEPRADQPFRVLLLRIARNRSIDYLRRHRRWEAQSPDELDGTIDRAELDLDPLGAFDALPDAELDVALKRLPVSQRQVVVLRYVFDLSTREVAEIIDATPQAVRNLQYRGLQFLRSALTRPGSLAAARPPAPPARVPALP
jgi:RNA polymerase sigma-70 factor (ECF subfamily)